ASITESRYSSASRCGPGCVFGSKNLKAIAARGTKGISVHDRSAFYKAISALLQAINVNPELRKSMMKSGSIKHVVTQNDNGWNGYRNGQGGQSPHAERLDGEWHFDHMQQRPLSCSPGCLSVCQSWHYIKGDESSLSGRYTGEHGHRPEYGMVCSFGTNCDIPDLPAVAHLVEKCNGYGLDCFEAGMSVSFLMELWQREIITERDMVDWAGEPLSLEWGNVETVEKLLDAIALQDNQLGQILRRGVYQAAKRIEELKGVPVLQYASYGKGGATHEGSMRSQPRAAFFATVSAVGCNHLKGAGIDQKTSERYLGKPFNPWSYSLKGASQALSEYFSSMYNSLGVCKRSGADLRTLADFPPELYTPALYALTGVEITPKELYASGQRIVNVQKAFNSRLGLRRGDDTLCHSWMNEPAPDGPGKGMKAADFLERAKDEYYEYHGWDKATSLQKKETLVELGLEDVVKVLEGVEALV
ncbi:aldehyde ferredoxin oxidoreductase C-terminal domain-containing protein, partial [Chloroflexota bacterium]